MKIGIFFFVEGQVMMDAVPVKAGESVRDTIQYGNHYEFWKNLEPVTSAEFSFKKWPYYTFPRGRVVYQPASRTFCVYADACLNHEDLALIIRRFGNEGSMTRIENDGHYQCANCNEYFDLAVR